MQKITFHSFRIGDTDEPELYAMYPIKEWLGTPKGEWVNEHCKDLSWHLLPDEDNYGYKVILRGSITDHQATEYFLKWEKES